MPQNPRHIACAVRGSPQSRSTVTYAIDRALETGARLTFFYAVDAEFLGRTTVRGSLRVVYRELMDMAEFSMLILKDRAERRGVTKVDSIVREGNARAQIKWLIEQVRPDVLIIGQPMRGAGSPEFKLQEFRAFVEDLEQAGDTTIEVAPGPSDK